MINPLVLSPVDSVRFMANAQTIVEKMERPSIPQTQVEEMAAQLKNLNSDEQSALMGRVTGAVLEDYPELIGLYQEVVARKAVRGGDVDAVQAVLQLLEVFSIEDWKDIAFVILCLNLSGKWKLTIGNFVLEKDSILPGNKKNT
ncbi:MAG: hypothetical protein HQL07_04090 [Nitrospirae bacterium]|nr:hypothetical protein [Magnetococcales bacterium]